MAKALDTLATGFDVRGILPLISVPTLVIYRADHVFMRPGHAHYLAEHIAGAKLVELPGRDHLAYVGETEPLLDEIEEFLTGTRGGSDTRAGARDDPVHRHRRLDETSVDGRGPAVA